MTVPQANGFGEDGALAGRKRPNEVSELDLCSSQLLKVSCVGEEKTPRSVAITANENQVLRMPDSQLMFKQQRSLQDMLADIHEDPAGFCNFIQDVRSEMKPAAACVPSPFDSQCGTLADYVTNQSVGKGRFSTVYYSIRKRDGLPCALKCIRLSAAPNNTKMSYTKCLKEVGLLRSLEHENVVRHLDSFLQDDELYIVLEWASKGDLKTFISSCRAQDTLLLEHQVWTFMSQCCEAVRHMHEKRIMHRDIKPSNIFIMEDGRLKLGDLGLGRYLDLQSIMAFSQVGTPLYMSPEVLRGEGHHFASDIWSLGCVLYELACLRSPFQQRKLTMDRLFLNIVKGEYPRMVAGDQYSVHVTDLVDNMLQTNPNDRPDIVRVADDALLSRSRTAPQAPIPDAMPSPRHRAARPDAGTHAHNIGPPPKEDSPAASINPNDHGTWSPADSAADESAYLSPPSPELADSTPAGLPRSSKCTVRQGWVAERPPLPGRHHSAASPTAPLPLRDVPSASTSQDSRASKSSFHDTLTYNQEEVDLMNELMSFDGSTAGGLSGVNSINGSEQAPAADRVDLPDAHETMSPPSHTQERAEQRSSPIAPPTAQQQQVVVEEEEHPPQQPPSRPPPARPSRPKLGRGSSERVGVTDEHVPLDECATPEMLAACAKPPLRNPRVVSFEGSPAAAGGLLTPKSSSRLVKVVSRLISRRRNGKIYVADEDGAGS